MSGPIAWNRHAPSTPINTMTPEFQRYYAAVLFREYCIRKRGQIGKPAWSHMLKWAWAARKRARDLASAGQGDLFAKAGAQ